jgi:hypothetical protein
MAADRVLRISASLWNSLQGEPIWKRALGVANGRDDGTREVGEATASTYGRRRAVQLRPEVHVRAPHVRAPALAARRRPPPALASRPTAGRWRISTPLCMRHARAGGPCTAARSSQTMRGLPHAGPKCRHPSSQVVRRFQALHSSLNSKQQREPQPWLVTFSCRPGPQLPPWAAAPEVALPAALPPPPPPPGVQVPAGAAPAADRRCCLPPLQRPASLPRSPLAPGPWRVHSQGGAPGAAAVGRRPRTLPPRRVPGCRLAALAPQGWGPAEPSAPSNCTVCVPK